MDFERKASSLEENGEETCDSTSLRDILTNALKENNFSEIKTRAAIDGVLKN